MASFQKMFPFFVFIIIAFTSADELSENTWSTVAGNWQYNGMNNHYTQTLDDKKEAEIGILDKQWYNADGCVSIDLTFSVTFGTETGRVAGLLLFNGQIASYCEWYLFYITKTAIGISRGNAPNHKETAISEVHLQFIYWDGSDHTLSVQVCDDATFTVEMDGVSYISITDTKANRFRTLNNGYSGYIGIYAEQKIITTAKSLSISGSRNTVTTFVASTNDNCVSLEPTNHPSTSPTPAPTDAPTKPTTDPSRAPSDNPSSAPTPGPTLGTTDPTRSPSNPPSVSPTKHPSEDPSQAPTDAPTKSTEEPSASPTGKPSLSPTRNPSKDPTLSPSGIPSISPTDHPSADPTLSPSGDPSLTPTKSTKEPTVSPTRRPSYSPSNKPSKAPTDLTRNPSIAPTDEAKFTSQATDDAYGDNEVAAYAQQQTFVVVIVSGSVCAGCMIAAIILGLWCLKNKKKAIRFKRTASEKRMNSAPPKSNTSKEGNGRKAPVVNRALSESDSGEVKIVHNTSAHNAKLAQMMTQQRRIQQIMPQEDEGDRDSDNDVVQDMEMEHVTAGAIVHDDDSESDIVQGITLGRDYMD